MGARDVIISALACGGKMSCRKEASEFKNPPLVININSSSGISTGGGTVQGFRKSASEYRKLGGGPGILKGIFKANKLKLTDVGRVCLVSYKEGWGFIHEVLKYDFPIAIDTIMVLDGLNTRSLDPWEGYSWHGNLWLAYSQTPHKTASSKSAANKLIGDYPTDLKIPTYIADAKLDKSVTIYSKSETPKTKIFHKDPLVKTHYSRRNFKFAGEMMSLEYTGKQAQDQTYIQQYVQPRLWKLLRERWSKRRTDRY